MSYCREEGKDRIFFVTKDDYEKPSTALVTTKNDDDEDEEPGLIMKDGSINWNCPCLGGMAAGPCGVPFRDAFSCFHYSEASPKGSECYDSFKKMQDCMSEYPELYPKDDDPKDPLADAPEKPEEKLESSSSEPAAGDNASSEAASDMGASDSSEVTPTEAASIESAPESVASESSTSEPTAESHGSSEVVLSETASTKQSTVEATS